MTLMMICQFVVIQAKLMQDRCMQVVYGCYFFDAPISQFIGSPVTKPAFYTATCQKSGTGIPVVVSAGPVL